MDGKTAMERMNFTAPNNVSYSFVNVYPSTTAVGKGYKTFITAFSSDFAVAADLAPGGEDMIKVKVGSPRSEMIKGNALNHEREGQNVLYADGHAEFEHTPLAGTMNDNIYTVNALDEEKRNLHPKGESVAGHDPAHAADSVLTPTAVARPKGMEITMAVPPASMGGDDPRSPMERLAEVERRLEAVEKKMGIEPGTRPAK